MKLSGKIRIIPLANAIEAKIIDMTSICFLLILIFVQFADPLLLVSTNAPDNSRLILLIHTLKNRYV